MLQWISGLLDRIFAVVGALLCAQTPMFIQQYIHQLSGHVYELKYQLNTIEQTASSRGKTLPQYIQKFIDSSDYDFFSQGQIMQGMIERTNSLSQAFQEITSASVFSKPFVFIRHLDWDIVKDTYTHFQIGIPLTFEGLIYSLAGICIGYAIFQVLSRVTLLLYQTLFDRNKHTSLTKG